MTESNGASYYYGDSNYYSVSGGGGAGTTVVGAPVTPGEFTYEAEGEGVAAEESSVERGDDTRLKQELSKTEEEILTLRQVLNAKTQQASDLKKKLGVSMWSEMKTDLKVGIQNIRESDTIQKTNEKLRELNDKVKATTVYQKTTEVVASAKEKTSTGISSAGNKVTEKLSTLRNSNTFKSFEEKVGSAYTSVKDRLTSSRSEQNFEEALKEELEKREQANLDEQRVEAVPTA